MVETPRRRYLSQISDPRKSKTQCTENPKALLQRKMGRGLGNTDGEGPLQMAVAQAPAHDEPIRQQAAPPGIPRLIELDIAMLQLLDHAGLRHCRLGRSLLPSNRHTAQVAEVPSNARQLSGEDRRELVPEPVYPP